MRRTVQIVLTERCNLSCVYCYERKKDCSVLSLELAKQVIRRAFEESSDDNEELFFYFHGGEVVLEFDRMRAICEWLWGQQWNRKYFCYAATNGTLVHGRVQEWFWTNRHRFCLGLSLDGTQQMHDANRSGSYGRIDFEFFRRAWPEAPVKMTISKLSLPTLAAGVRHVHDLGFDLMANLAYDKTWTEDLLPCYCKQLSECVSYYLEHPDRSAVSLLARKLQVVGYADAHPGWRPPRKWCGTGLTMRCYDMRGNAFPCQSFMPSTGAVAGDTILGRIDFSDVARFADPQCADCPFEPVCATCYAYNFYCNGDVRARSRVLCKYRKVEALMTAVMQGKMLVSGARYKLIRELAAKDIPLLARGVQIINEAFARDVHETCRTKRNGGRKDETCVCP